MEFSGKNTGVGCHFLRQGIFLTQGSNLHLCLLDWQAAAVFYSENGQMCPQISFFAIKSGRNLKFYNKCNGLVSKLCLTFVTPWTAACQAPLSMGFPQQKYWSGCYFLLQGIFPNQGLNLSLLNCRRSPTIAGGFFTNWSTREVL